MPGTTCRRCRRAGSSPSTALQLHAITQERDKLGGKFTYRNAKDQKITITTKALTAETATVGIRVGVFGDQTQSMLILDRIRARLK